MNLEGNFIKYKVNGVKLGGENGCLYIKERSFVRIKEVMDIFCIFVILIIFYEVKWLLILIFSGYDFIMG